jgi:hypothetical protein
MSTYPSLYRLHLFLFVNQAWAAVQKLIYKQGLREWSLALKNLLSPVRSLQADDGLVLALGDHSATRPSVAHIAALLLV